MSQAEDQARYQENRAVVRGMSTDALFAAARIEVQGQVPRYPAAAALRCLHERATRAVFDSAARMLPDDDPINRKLGARVLRELGEVDLDGRRPFSGDAVPLLVARLGRESDPDVLIWVVTALAYNGAREALGDILRLLDHPDDLVRYQLAVDLPSLVDPAGIEPGAADALFRLCRDVDPDTRWYALTALVEEAVGVDPGRLERTLTALLDDPDEQVRALAGEHHRDV